MASVVVALISTVVGAVVGADVRARVERWAVSRNLARAEDAVTDGRTARVFASFRRPSRRGPGGRWRHGFLEADAAGPVSWIPRRPRPGRPTPLPRLRVDGARAHTRGETWWIDGRCTILRARSADGDLEIALLPEGLELLAPWLGSGPQRAVSPEVRAQMVADGPLLSAAERVAWKRDIADDAPDPDDPWTRRARRPTPDVRRT